LLKSNKRRSGTEQNHFTFKTFFVFHIAVCFKNRWTKLNTVFELEYMQLQIDHFSVTYPSFMIILGRFISEFVIFEPNF
jgi:hypothetical protein